VNKDFQIQTRAKIFANTCMLVHTIRHVCTPGPLFVTDGDVENNTSFELSRPVITDTI